MIDVYVLRALHRTRAQLPVRCLQQVPVRVSPNNTVPVRINAIAVLHSPDDTVAALHSPNNFCKKFFEILN
jgi:hypothetical protein